MAADIKAVKKSSTARSAGALEAASAAQTKSLLVAADKLAALEVGQHSLLAKPVKNDEALSSAIRKKKKTAETDAQEAASGASVEIVSHDVAQPAQAHASSDTGAELFRNLEMASADLVQTHHITEAPVHNMLGALSYEMLLEVVGGAAVGGVAMGISKASVKSADTTAPAAPQMNNVTDDNAISAAEAQTGIYISGINEATASTTINGHAVTQYNATNWFYKLSQSEIASLNEGTNVLTAVSTDHSGNTSVASKTFIVDRTGPVAATVATLAGDDTINATEGASSVVLSGTNEAGATVSINGAEATVLGTSWFYIMSPSQVAQLGQGAEALSIVSTDAAGNSTTTTKNISIDTVVATPQIQLNPAATIHTSLGDITVELNPGAAPITTANWLSYVNDDFYNNLIFHRVMPGFMVQGGGFEADLTQVTPTYPAITLESNNGLSNLRGTIAMARTSVADSATDQFYINLVDNTFLDYSSSSSPGYAVFGKVTAGMSVVDSIAAQPTATINGMANVPTSPITINSIDQILAGVAHISTGQVTLSGLETGAHWEYHLDSATTWTPSSTATLNLGTAGSGAHTVYVRQVDAAGNTSAIASTDFILG